MTLIRLDDADDPRLAAYRDLRGRTNRCDGHFIAEGRFVVRRLLASNLETASLLVDASQADELVADLPSGVITYVLPREVVREVVGFPFHRGVLACGIRPAWPVWTGEASADTATLWDATEPVTLVPIGISDAENLGSLFRSAAALGVRQVLIGPGTIDPFARRVIRVSMGTVFDLNLRWMPTDLRTVTGLPACQRPRLLAAALDAGAIDIRQLTAATTGSERDWLLVGNEAEGLSQEIISIADERVMIPMAGHVDSLNVAVAAAILMHDLMRRLGRDAQPEL